MLRAVSALENKNGDMTVKKLALIALMVFAAATATADETRKVDFTATLYGPDGKTFCMQSDAKNNCSASWTLGDLVVFALNRTGGDPAAQKANFKVLESISGNKTAELNSDAQKAIQDALWALRPSLERQGATLPLAAVGVAVKAINPADVK